MCRRAGDRPDNKLVTEPTDSPTEVVSLPEQGDGLGDLPPIERLRRGWRRYWQVPAMIGASFVLVGGVGLAVVTRPKPAFTPVVDRAETLIGRGEPRKAIELLNERVYPWLEKAGTVPQADERRYHLLIARAIYDGQAKFGLSSDENRVSVIREYQAAERMGATLGALDLFNLADTYADRNEMELALARANTIPPGVIPGKAGGRAGQTGSSVRDRVYQRVIDDWLGSSVPRFEQAQELITQMLADDNLPIGDRVWALARRAQLQINQGYPEEAITRLLRAMPRLEEVEPELLAELTIQLGRAYVATRAYREAEGQFDRVLQLAHDNGSLRAAALLGLARVREARDETVEARDLYMMVTERYSDEAAYLPALLGLAEAEAALHATPASLEAYGRLVEAMNAEIKPPVIGKSSGLVVPLSLSNAHDSLLRQHLDQMTLRQFDTGLEFAALAGKLYDRDKMPPVVTQALANGHRALAGAIIGAFSDEPLKDLAVLGPSTRAEAQRHMMQAAAYYRLHADQFILTDNDQYGRSLWESADLFDRAGDQEEAAEAFREYADNNPSGQRHTESRFRLARAYQALGKYDLAGEWYEGLIEDQKNGDASVGPLAVRSFVPLAQCYLNDSDAENDAKAEKLLVSSTDGSQGRTGSSQFHEALVELGTLFYRSGRFERAIERFDEALQRYPDDPELNTLKYLHADSNRKLADEIEISLRDPMPDTERRTRTQRFMAHRRKAMDEFEQVRTALEGQNPAALTSLDKIYLRNSYFYLGDCAFDLGAFDDAVKYYDAAQQRYPGEPSSLVAMIQIVNAYIEQGDLNRARTAQERARRFYMSLPDEVWDDPALPMGRKDWQRWLDSSAMLYSMAEGG